MASPVNANRTATAFASLASWSIPLPTGIVAGDLLVIYQRSAGNIAWNVPANWTILYGAGDDATDDIDRVVYRWADGTEGTTLTATFGAAVKGCALVWRITGAANPATQPPEISTIQIFTTVANTGNSPAISPTGGSKDYLFITCIGYGGATISGTGPTNYQGTGAPAFFLSAGSTGGSATTNCVLMAASRAVTTATEDPGLWTHPAASAGGIAFTIAIHPAAPTGPQTYFGVVARATTFTKAVVGSRKTFSSLALPLIYGQAISGRRKVFSSLALPITFTKATAGIAVAPPKYGAVSAAFTLDRAVAGQKQTFGVVARPTTFTKAVQGQRTTFSSLAASFSFGEVVQGRRKAFGVLAAPFVFGKAVQGQRKTFGVVAAPLTFGKAVQGQRRTFGVVARPTTLLIATQGFTTVGPKTYFGVVARPINLLIATQGAATAGVPAGTLNAADNIYVGSAHVDRVYVGATQVWPS